MRIVSIGGRQLKVVPRANILHAHWMDTQIIKAGLDRVNYDPAEGGEAVAMRVIDALKLSGAAVTLVSGLLMPADLPNRAWTPAIAEEMAAFIGPLEDPKDETIFNGIVADVILDFFRRGLVSFVASRTFSSGPSDVLEPGLPDTPRHRQPPIEAI